MTYSPEQNRDYSLSSMEDAVEHVKNSAKDGLVLFLGAGVSNAPPSNCPTWNALLELVMSSAQEGHAGIVRYCDLLGQRLSGLKPELFCQVLYNNLLGDFFGFLDILYMGQPNTNHYSIAHMTREYVIPVIMTTNFDVHIENALGLLGTKPSLHVCSSPGRLRKSLKNRTHSISKTRVIKIHGSLDDRASIVLTLRQAGLKLKEDLADLVRNAFRSYTVLVVGYSGNDDDIFPVFLNIAPEAKKVFWVLWDNQESMTHNIKVFAAACPKCTLVAADGKNIFERLVHYREGTTPGVGGSDLKIRQSEFLRRWAAGINEHCWKNFLSELLLLVDCGNDFAKFIAEESEVTVRTATDAWVVTRALKNRALALIILKKYSDALAVMSRAADNYMLFGHHREVIECLTVMNTRIPLKATWRGDDPLFWSAQLSGKTYEPYCLGLYNYSAGIHFLKERRLDLAQYHLLVAGGQAKRCGDRVTLMRCLEGLGEIFGMKDEIERQRQCHEEIVRMNSILGVHQSALIVGDSLTQGENDEGDGLVNGYESQIVKDCEVAGKKEMRKLILGEAIIVLVLSLILGAVACIFTHDLWSRLGTFISVLLTGAATKIWNAKKRFVKYRHIDRS